MLVTAGRVNLQINFCKLRHFTNLDSIVFRKINQFFHWQIKEITTNTLICVKTFNTFSLIEHLTRNSKSQGFFSEECTNAGLTILVNFLICLWPTLLKELRKKRHVAPLQSHTHKNDLLVFDFNWKMGATNKSKKLGFLPKTSKDTEKKEIIKEPKGRLIEWSPWPPANFKTRYPAFPLVTTVLILIILSWAAWANWIPY